LKLCAVNEKFNYYSLRPDLKILKNFYEQILQNTQLKKIIAGCLGSKNYIYSINTMISIPSKNKHSVTDLHRDYDDTNFLALAVYWTDVESDDGATYFVPFTHNRYVDEKNNLLDKGVYLKGIAGSAYLMDTYGWHAGNKNLKKKRIVTWIRFSKNQFNVSSFDNKEQFFFKYFNELWN
jgi:ectoine hydroxylase-related dioxygenase (phytanoyl-CoA dioxygenase family)